MKKLILILLLNFSLLFSPSPIPGTTIAYGRYVSLNRHAGFFINPDAYGFILPAISPKQLLEFHSQRQNRPLFVVAGSAMGYTINLLTYPIRHPLMELYGKFWRGAYPKEQIFSLGNFYAGFILLNILILWLALFLFEKIFNILVGATPGSRLPMFLLMVFFVSNPVTKAFFWTVHQQMFALLTPLLCIYILIRFNTREYPVSFKQTALIYLLGGLLLLVYGNFILLLPSLLFAFIYQEIKRGNLKNWFSLLLKTGMLTGIFFIPTLAWIEILHMNGVEYYNFEMKVYHHLVWIPETLHQSFELFFQQLIANTVEYFLTMRVILIWILSSLVIFFFGKIRLTGIPRLFLEITYVFLYSFLFYWILGAYFERLTYTLIPILVCFWLVVLGSQLTGKRITFILSSLALSWHLYILMSYGPFY